jgi:hypothetical protein
MLAELHKLWLANVTAMTPSKLRDVTSNAACRRLLVNRIRANLMFGSGGRRWTPGSRSPEPLPDPTEAALCSMILPSLLPAPAAIEQFLYSSA